MILHKKFITYLYPIDFANSPIILNYLVNYYNFLHNWLNLFRCLECENATNNELQKDS